MESRGDASHSLFGRNIGELRELRARQAVKSVSVHELNTVDTLPIHGLLAVRQRYSELGDQSPRKLVNPMDRGLCE
jgi:hypothetical protein